MQGRGHRFDPGYLHQIKFFYLHFYIFRGFFPSCSLTIEYGSSGKQFCSANLFFQAQILNFAEHKRDLLKTCFDQAMKGIRWMPWHREAMKDVVSCDKLRGGANNL